MIMNGSARALALFDFDGTLIRGDSIVPYLKLALRLKAISAGEYCAVTAQTLRYLAGGLTDDQIKTRALRFRGALSPERRDALDRAFAQECLLPRVFPQGLACLRRHQKENAVVALVSASTENYMRFVAQALKADALLCTPVLEDGSVRGNCKGEEKVRRIQAWIKQAGLSVDFSASYAYGDSESDLPMLRLCGHPILVNPKRALRKAVPDMPRVIWKEREETASS